MKNFFSKAEVAGIALLAAMIAFLSGIAIDQFFISSKVDFKSLISAKNAPLNAVSPDTSEPKISNVTIADLTRNSAVVRWITDEKSTTTVVYCRDGADRCGDTGLDINLVTEHTVKLTGLEPGTTYHLTLKSTDASGNQAICEWETPLKTLAELKDTTAPTISSINADGITRESAIITWDTDEPATSQVEHGNTTAYGARSKIDNNLTKTHTVKLSGLSPFTIYHYRVISKDAAGNETKSEDKLFKTHTR